MRKRLLTVIMAVCLAATSIPLDSTAYAGEVREEQVTLIDSTETTESGSAGTEAMESADSTGTITETTGGTAGAVENTGGAETENTETENVGNTDEETGTIAETDEEKPTGTETKTPDTIGSTETEETETESPDTIGSTETVTEDTKAETTETEETETEETETESPDAEETETTETVTEETEITENELEEETESKEEALELPLNFIMLESDYLEAPAKQNVVASIGDGIADFKKLILTYKNVTTGESFETVSTDQAEDMALFSMDFSEESKNGVYELMGISYETGTARGTIEFSGLDMQVTFGVGTAVEAKPDQIISEEEPGTAADLDVDVITMDENGDVISKESSKDMAGLANSMKYASGGNRVIVLDPGHDNTHSGAHQNGVAEEALVLKIAQYCKAELETYANVTVYMTRNSGDCPNGGSSVTSGICNERRVAYAQSVGADAYISFHLNSSVSSSANGVGVYYPNSNYNAGIGQVGQGIAQKIYEKLRALGLSAWGSGTMIWNATEDKYDDGSAADYLGVIRNCKKAGIPAVLIEHAFLSSYGDYSSFLNSDDKLKALGVADATAIAEYYGLQKGNGAFSISYVQSQPGGKLNVVWGKTNNVSYYEVWRSTKKNSGYKKQADVSKGTSYVDDEIQIGKTYYYKIRAVYTNGQLGEPTAAMSGFALAQAELTYAKSQSSKKIEIGWEGVAGSEGYQIFRKDSADGDFKQVGKVTSGGTLTYVDKVASNNKAYTYKVQAYNTSGNVVGTGAFSGEMTAKALAQTSIREISTESANCLKLTWKRVGGAEGYQIYRSTQKSKGYKKIATVKSGKTVSYQDSKVKFGITYYYKIQAFGGEGENLGYSGYSAVKSAKTTITTKITSVVSVDSNTLEIRWNKVNEAYGYRILRSTSKNGTYKEIKTIKKAKTVKYQDKKVTPGKKYYYKIEILVKSGSKIIGNGISKQVAGKTLGGTTVTSVTAAANVMTLKWKKVSDADGYQIFRSTKKNGAYDLVGTVTGEKTVKYKDKNLSYGKTYYYKVRAYRSKGKQTETGSLTGAKKTWTLKKAVVTKAVPSGQKVELAWNEVAKAKGYSVYRSENKAGKFQKIGSVASGSTVKYTDKTVELGKTYYYKVAADYSITGKDKSIGGYSDIVTVPVLDASHLIMGSSSVTVEQMLRYYNARYTFPAEVYTDKGAASPEAFFTILKEEADAEGVKAEVLFAQVILETNGLRFGGDVSAIQCNFGGLGATGNGVAGETFPDVRTGLRAQTQHLKAYASTEALNNPCVDTRFSYVTRGCAPYIEWLAIPKNPYGKGWAADADYGDKLLRIIGGL